MATPVIERKVGQPTITEIIARMNATSGNNPVSPEVQQALADKAAREARLAKLPGYKATGPVSSRVQ